MFFLCLEELATSATKLYYFILVITVAPVIPAGVHGQITARLNTAVEQVLTTPRGLLPHEVTASALVKVDMQGVVQDQGTTNFPVNVDGERAMETRLNT